MKTLLTATAIVLSMTAAAGAAEASRATETLAGGPIYAGGQGGAFCEFINVGTANITPTTQSLFEDFSTTALPTNSSCPNGTPVAPNQTCYIYNTGTLTSGYSISCALTFNAPVTNVRGALELYESDFTTLLATVELR